MIADLVSSAGLALKGALLRFFARGQRVGQALNSDSTAAVQAQSWEQPRQQRA